MKKIKCCNCSIELTEEMDLQCGKEICELFCSKECAIEFYMKEMNNVKVDISNIRDYVKFAYVSDGNIYHSDIEDDACSDCEDGLFNFYKFEVVNGNRYEVYKCSECGKETKVACK